MEKVPVGIKFISFVSRKVCKNSLTNRHVWYRCSVLFLTFISYTCYHISRKPLSVVKTYFNRSCEGLIPPENIIINDLNRNNWCEWAPFYGPQASTLLGALDSAFLFAYAAFMFLSGFVAERVSLRYFLALGMIFSGISCYLLGIAQYYNIHSMWYFILAQVFGGIFQTTGWPGVVAVMGNWFGKSKRGLIFGLWNSHTSVGNILGAVIASRYLDSDWGLSFIVPGIIIAVVGFLNFLFLVESPSDVGCDLALSSQPCNTRKFADSSAPDLTTDESADSDTELLSGQDYGQIIERNYVIKNDTEKAVGFIGALKIPGVIEFSLCLFFAKLVSYTFLYWLPLYINSATTLSPSLSSDISTIFDVGGIVGGVIAGAVSDYSNMSATTCSVMLIISIPLMFLYYLYGTINMGLNITLLILVGFFVNGPYALITTAVSAELGCHKSLSGNSKALATVTAIIDGTGSIGAAVGPLLAGIVCNYGWQNVFYILMLSDVIALLMLVRLVKNEIQRYQLFDSSQIRI